MLLKIKRDIEIKSIFSEGGFTGKVISVSYSAPYRESDFTARASLSFPLCSGFLYRDSRSSLYLSSNYILVEPVANYFSVHKYRPSRYDVTLSVELPASWWSENIATSEKLRRNHRLQAAIKRVVDGTDARGVNRLKAELEILRKLLQIKNYIDRHFNDNLSLTFLADRCCMSKFHFIREFHEVFGVTPHKFLINRRLFQSKCLLLEGENVLSATYACGWNSPQHFCAAFKKHYGQSPSSYQLHALRNLS